MHDPIASEIYETIKPFIAKSKQEKVEHLISQIFNRYLLHIWSVDDIRTAAEDLGFDLLDEQCLEVLHFIEVDSEYGVSWNTVRNAIDDYNFKDHEDDLDLDEDGDDD